MNRFVPQLFIALTTSFTFVVAAASATTAEAQEAKYDYRVTWNGVPAASATVIVTENPLASVAQLRADVRTNRVIDMVYSFRASVWGAYDPEDGQSRGFSFHRSAGSRIESTRIEVGEDGKLVGRHERVGRADKIETIDEPGVLDPVTALLRFRHELPPPGSVTQHELFTGETRYRIEIEHQGEERLQVPAGSFDAIKVTPRVWRLDKKDDRISSVTAWVTRDAPHTILRVRSQVFIGSVYSDLTRISRSGY